MTLYASKNDKAIAASMRFHGYPRAGGAAKPIKDLDVIEASTVDTSFVGHSYFGSAKSVLADLFALLRHEEPPPKRFGMTEMKVRNGVYYVFRP